MDPLFTFIDVTPERSEQNHHGYSYPLLYGFAQNFVGPNPFRNIPDRMKRFRNGWSVEENQAQLGQGIRTLVSSLGLRITDFQTIQGRYFLQDQNDHYLNYRIRCEPNAEYQTEEIHSPVCIQLHFSTLPISSQIFLLYVNPKKHGFLLRHFEDFFTTFCPLISHQDVRNGFVERLWSQHVLGDPYFAKYFVKFLEKENLP